IAVSVLTKILPRRLHNAAIALLVPCGQVGSAIFPFITGALANKHSPAVLQPVMCVLLAGQFLLWMVVPRVQKKTN
ncbi:hypothetical protein JCM8547_004838, partial [Rhodosporidiobolus lusitaniae]